MSGLHLSSDVAHTREGRHLNHGSKELFPGDRGSKTLQVVLVLMLTDLPMQALIVMNRSRLFEHINGSGG